MYNPKDILTPSGYGVYKAHLFNIELGLDYILNHADDLHIGMGVNDESLDTLYCMQELLRNGHLLNGDGEKEEID